MALHTGVCEERGGDYFGPVVNRAARLEAIAHGGQVLVSGATAELLAETPVEGVELQDLGRHRLKDLGRPEHVFQLRAKELEASFPALASLDNPELPNNLPSLPSSFVGREREMEAVRGLVASSRLVTLTGVGGCGKTRLALQVAAELLDASPDGVWYVELAPLREPDRIPEAVAAALGLQEQRQGRAVDALLEALGGLDTLLILDNCEHLIDAAAHFCDRAIRQSPRLRILATSREPLGIDGEQVYRVPSLTLPPGDVAAAEDLGDADAVRLFVERAQARNPGLRLGGAALSLVASICRRLDGIPLALELAAARLSSMSLTHLNQRLDQRFRILTGGSRSAMPRQQTLQATVDWSFELLSEDERQTLRAISVFAGSFELEAAEAICAVDGIEALDLVLGSLVDKSLVEADGSGESVRYRLLETIRQYAAMELLRSDGEARVHCARGHHAQFYLRLAEEARPALIGQGQGRWLRRLDLEWDNLAAALAYLEAEGATEDVLRLGVGLHRFATSRGHSAVLTSLRRAVERADPAPSRLLADALIACARLIRGCCRRTSPRPPSPGAAPSAPWTWLGSWATATWRRRRCSSSPASLASRVTLRGCGGWARRRWPSPGRWATSTCWARC